MATHQLTHSLLSHSTALRTTPLSPFVLEGVVDLNEVIGHGSYAVVKKLNFQGLECVGKKMHEVLYINATPQERHDLLTRFEGECELLSRLHHPCIVQFMGVCFEEGSPLPVLIMECLYSTLAAVIDRYGVLPDQISYGILCDVSLGLRYLHEHSPPIIHRDLSANNVLLTRDTSAKISDLGVAKILDLTPARMTQLVQTKAPGTPCYMPPEALIAQPKYSTKIDIYSMGVMMIHTFCGEWPFPTDVFQPDPRDPNSMVPVTEVERRAGHLCKIRDDHPLTPLMCRCLSNNPSLRPCAAQIHSQLAEVQNYLPAVPETRIEMIRKLQESQDEVLAVEKSLSDKVEAIQQEKENKTPRLSVVQLFHPQSKLQWRRCTDMPIAAVEMQAVAIDNHVYIGGGVPQDEDSFYAIYRYSLAMDEWACLPDHSVAYFGLGSFQGNLITVGGSSSDKATNRVFCFSSLSKKWMDFVEPMPTARANPAILSTAAMIIACGGNSRDGYHYEPLATVEVYSSTTLQWYTADPLPHPCWLMSSVTISGCGYLMGGFNVQDTPIKDVFHIDLAELIDRATSHSQDPNTTSAWRTLPEAPLKTSAAATLSGSLLAIGGYDGNNTTQSTVHVFTPFTNSWAELPSSNLPLALYESTAVRLPSNRVMVVGGRNCHEEEIAACFIGSINTI